MNRTLKLVNRASAAVGLTLLLLVSACADTDATVSAEDVANDGSAEESQGIEATGADNGDGPTKTADELRGFFEATEWEIIERTGFETSTIGGTVSFGEVEQLLFMGLITSDGVNGSLMIEWNDEGFTSVADDQGFTGSHDDAGTEEPDLFEFLNGESFLAEISDDGSVATLRSRGRALVLGPAA